MTQSIADTFVLDEAQAAFVQRRVAINVASNSAERLPSLARAIGCRVSEDRRTVTIFLSVPRSATLLRDLRAGGGIAAVFTRPTTHETIQLKGAAATIVPLEESDRAAMQACAASFLEEIFQLGYKDPFATAMIAAVGDDSIGVAFQPTTAFLQTPGPSAGTKLGTNP
ncbi:MAG: hypothetical protein AMJ84_06370 [Acidithiobacillales bacterium SM23_46]|jgi:hypothetical protein|nr:MAG: hypothetical protein AMJ84_06370 [Acidithiobacillales bacterium SM23_46]KPL27649.1 MAG: hypothetical protein AMJ72_07695 [Acidithiobacillales bacterium SM1_46]